MTALALLLAGAAAASPPPPPPPTRAALQRALAAYERSAVEVEGPRGRGPGITVGAAGEVLTATDFVGPEGAVVWRGDARVPARVVLTDEATRLALLRPGTSGTPAVPVRALEAVAPGRWLLAVSTWRGRRFPVRVQSLAVDRHATAPHFALAHALPVGSPLFDEDGRLVALVVRAPGRSRRLALPLAGLQRRLSGAP